MKYLFLSFLIAGGFIFLIIKVVFYIEKTNQLKTQIKRNVKTIETLESSINGKDRKETFRLRLENTRCELEILQIGNLNIRSIKSKTGVGWITDIRHTGLNLICGYDFPVRENVELNLRFSLDKYAFTIRGKLAKKEEYIDHEHFIYDVEFTEQNTQTLSNLSKVLFNIELENRKKRMKG